MINEETIHNVNIPKTIIQHENICLRIKTDIRQKFETMFNMSLVNRRPKLCVICLENQNQNQFMNDIKKVCSEIGFIYQEIKLSNNISYNDLVKEITKLNQDKNTDGILLLGYSKNDIYEHINNSKDVEGITPYNQGKLFEYYSEHPQSENFILPSIANSCITLIKSIKSSISGKNVVIIGNNMIIDKQIGLLLVAENMNVILCNKNISTEDLQKYLSEACVVVISNPESNQIDPDMIHNQAIVIDLVEKLDVKKIKENKSQVGFYISGKNAIDHVKITMIINNLFTLFMKNEF
jgi:methylenetetrahydrofolate dehydrogenase (NADP+)/methenyltetrahydrofolate cyclohydrolase